MAELVTVARQELTAGEILDILEDGDRVRIEVSMLGKSMEMVVREHAGTYYCDTPMKLVKHDTREGFRNCLEKFRLAKSDGPSDGTSGDVGDLPDRSVGA